MMLDFLARRLLVALLVCATVLTFAFVLTRLGGDLAISIAGPNATAADIAQVRVAYGLDRPMPVQFLEWVGRLEVPRGDTADGALLIVGGAGGVPSIAIQLARLLTGATVIATASRPESAAWVRGLGAQHVVDHARPLAAQVSAIPGLPPVRWIFSTHTSRDSWAELARIVAPQGRIGLIDDPEPLDLRLVKLKSVSIHWEAMFTRPMFATADMIRQHEILCEIAGLVDAGQLRATATQAYGTIRADNLRRAHAAIEAGRVVGKIVLEGF